MNSRRIQRVHKTHTLGARGILTGILVISTVAAMVVQYDNKDDNHSLQRVKSKNEVVQLNITPHTGIYPGKHGYIYSQVDEVISDASEEYELEEWKMSVLARELDIEPVYSDKSANVYTDLSCVELTDGNLFTVENYNNISRNSYGSDENLEGDRRNFVDVVYSLAKGYKEFENSNVDNNEYINNDTRIKYLTDEDKSYVKFSLDALDFIGKGEYKDKFCTDYKNIIDTVQENNLTTKVIYVNNENNTKINGVIEDNVVRTEDTTDDYVNTLSNILSGSTQFTNNVTFCKNYEEPTVPVVENSDGVEQNSQFRYLELTRRNMMVAATSLVGKVRYIWGGGHGGGAQIAGANPTWEKFNNAYKEKGIDGCLESSSGSCPIHGNSACAYRGPSVNTIEEYINAWDKQMSDAGFENAIDGIDANKMYSVFRDRNTVSEYKSQSLGLHQLDGLDCSGFTCWVYNQVDSYDTKDTVAVSFVNTDDVKRIKLGDELYPGDAIGWDTHIVVVFGKYADNCYIVVEQTPDVLRFGAVSVGNGSKYLDEAGKYADELNAMAGIDTSENKAVKRQLEKYSGRSLGIARLDRPFEDEGVEIPQYGKSFENLTAQEIVEYIGYKG